MAETKNKEFPMDVRAKAVAALLENEKKYPTRYAASRAIGAEFGCSSRTLLSWVAAAERSGDGVPSSEGDDAAALVAAAEQARESGDTKRALALFEKVLTVEPKHVQALTMLARLRRDAGDADGSAETYRQLLQVRPKSFEALRAVGEYELQRGHREAAFPLLRQAFEIKPTDARTCRNTARLALEFDDLALAENAFAGMEEGDRFSGLKSIAARRLARQEYASALETFTELLKIRPGDLQLSLGIARALRNLREFDKARAVMRIIGSGDSPSLEVLREHGALLEATGDAEGALEKYRRAQQLAPEDAGLASVIARCLAKSGKAADARAQWQDRLEKDPRSTEALKALAGLAEKDGDTTEALALYRRVLDVDPDDHAVRVHVARRYLAPEDGARAEEEFRKALAAGYRKSGALVGLGGVLERSGRLEEAASLYAEAIETGDTAPRLRLALAAVQSKLKRYEDAEASYRGVLAIEATSVAALGGLARTLVARGKPADAVEFFLRALKAEPDNSALRLALARAYRMAGQFPAAYLQCDLLALKSETRADAEHERALCLQAEGRHSESFRLRKGRG
ncbi:MAG: hypothetical protein CTY25_03590 [Methylobacterium sp.]|nr:MAG: hypothetical protein CTY25_03590 [Methylobacterium sp.]